MKKAAFPILIIALAILIVGCATIISGTKQNVSINSTPASAMVVVKTTGGVEFFSGATPATCKLPRKNEYIVYINLEGYKEKQIPINKDINMWVIGNLLCGGVLGFVIDAVDGAMWKLEPETIHVTLVTALKDGVKTKYAVFGALDDNGQLRTLAVPLVPTTF